MSAKTVLTVADSVTYHQPGRNPQGFTHPFSRSVKNCVQPYHRQLSVEEGWFRLDPGWVDDAACMVIHNEEGLNLRTAPTVEQIEELRRKVLEVSRRGDGVADELLFPTETIRTHPADLEHIAFRSRHGLIRFSVYLFPE